MSNSDNIRDIGKNTISTVLKKNVKTLEKYIHNKCEEEYGDNTEKYEKNYKRILYQIVGDIINKVEVKDIISNLKMGNICWDHNAFKNIKQQIQEQDDFIINPFEVEEGVTECKKCGSKRVFTFSKQCRSSDEPSTTFAKCIKCKANWTYSG